MIQSIQIGPFTLRRLLAPFGEEGLVIKCADGEGGIFPLASFEAEVCPWSEVERADEEKVRRFYERNF